MVISVVENSHSTTLHVIKFLTVSANDHQFHACSLPSNYIIEKNAVNSAMKHEVTALHLTHS